MLAMPTAWRTLVTSLVPMMWIEESSYQKKASLHSGLRVARAQLSQVPGCHRLPQLIRTPTTNQHIIRSFAMLFFVTCGFRSIIACC